MKVKVTVEAQIDTDRIPECNRNVKVAIEKVILNGGKSYIAEGWALQEVENQNSRRWISLEIL